MEVKINREIRDYTESLFFGLSLRQFIFSVLAELWPAKFLRYGNGKLDVHFGCRPFCGAGIYQLPRHDGGAVIMGVYQIGVSHAQEADLLSHQHLLRGPEIRH